MKKSALDQIFIFFSVLLTSSPGLIRHGLAAFYPSATSIKRQNQLLCSVNFIG
jgi:hypothetical protein